MLLGAPCAHVEMAVWRQSPGWISASLRSARTRCSRGRLLETCKVPGYVHHGKGELHPGHSLENIRAALAGLAPAGL